MVNDADPQLRHPGRFFSHAVTDLRVAFSLSKGMLGPSLKARYRQSLLGYVWLLTTPLAIAGVWIFLHRSRVVDFGPTGIPYPVYVITGVMLWTAFLKVLNSPLQQLQASRHILAKIGFPWEALVLTGWGEAIVETAIFLGIIVLVHVAYAIPVAPLVAGLPVVIALLILGAGIGLVLAPIGMLYDDIPRAVGLSTYLLFFLTPIIYPVPTEMPGLIATLGNPVALLLVTAREVMSSQPVSHPVASVAASIGAAVALLVGLLTFRLSIPHVVSKL